MIGAKGGTKEGETKQKPHSRQNLLIGTFDVLQFGQSLSSYLNINFGRLKGSTYFIFRFWFLFERIGRELEHELARKDCLSSCTFVFDVFLILQNLVDELPSDEASARGNKNR